MSGAQETSAPPAAGGNTGENPFAFLQSQPQFALIRQAVQQNPSILPTLLQELGSSNPELLQVLARSLRCPLGKRAKRKKNTHR